MYFWIVQAIGFVGMLVCILSYQCKSSHWLIFLQLCGNIIYAIQFFMLKGYTGCVTLGIAMFSNGILFLSSGRKWANWKGWKWVFVLLYVAVAAATWQNVMSLLPCVAAIASTLSNWTRNGKTIRLARLAVTGPFWLIYDTYTCSISGVLCELFGIGSILISIHRYGMEELNRVD